ncbi:MAG: hypothetical protein HZA52_06160 [Planctomycetes bacterium]|nr:hypothetical protein [Planctomycetota bacterium]
MSRSLARLWLVLVLVTASPFAFAQAPKAGGYYEDKTDLGFKVQVPKDWDFVPPQPNDPNLIGKYVAPHNGGLRPKSISGIYWGFEVQIAKFDRREQDDDDGDRPRGRGAESPTEFLEDAFGRIEWAAAGEKSSKIGKLKATELQFTGTWTIDSSEGSEEIPVRAFVAVISLAPDLDVALIGNGPGDEKKWGKFESAFQTMARSVKLVETTVAAARPAGGSMRDQKRAKIADELTRLPGWALHESPNYFIVTDSKDEPFVKEMMDRLEAIRKIYEETYTQKQALELRRKAIALKAARTDSGGTAPAKPAGEGEEEEEPEEPLTEEGLLASFEASRACVVRLCSEEAMYLSYGGPNGSAGYWSPFHEELVVYDDQKDGGRNNTWKTLNHEAFHQYIFYFYGSLSPHSWYNEGSGDFYSGYQYGKNKKFILKPFDWRVQPVRDMLRDETFTPLKTLVRYTQAEYYGPRVGDNYAQGWSFIYFLRTAPGKFTGWKPEWNAILPTYLDTLAVTGDLAKAVDTAFEGVDYDELTAAWKAYLEKEL